MKLKLVTTLVAIGTIATGTITATITKAHADTPVQFICGKSYDPKSDRFLPTTLALTPRGKIDVIQWVKALGSYAPEARCKEVSPRFQEAYENGNFNLITNGIMNGKPVICTATEVGGSCSTLLITLRPEDDSWKIINDLKDILNGRGVGPIKHSSGTPQVYYQIDIDDFLRNAPVEK